MPQLKVDPKAVGAAVTLVKDACAAIPPDLRRAFYTAVIRELRKCRSKCKARKK